MNRQRGFSVIEIIIGIVIVGLIGVVAWVFVQNIGGAKGGLLAGLGGTFADSQNLIWTQSQNDWEAHGTPPACPSQPMLKSPADLSKATSVLYPGQIRGGNYKPHGGLRFDNANDNVVTVVAPMSGYVARGTSYVEMGEIQYMFDIINNCGVMYRLDHLHDISSALQKIAAQWPTPSESSMTHQIQPAVYIKQGDTLATKVGFISTKNAGFDFGVYDLRATNPSSESNAYQVAHPQRELAWHAVCWLKGWLPTSDQTLVLALPAGDQKNGKISDYCQ